MLETYQFALGNFNCTVINDGNLRMGPTSIFFTGATKAELNTVLAEHNLSPDALNIPCSCLLVDTGEHRILVDCGSGGESGGLDGDLGHLFAGLNSIGLTSNDITHVILTHGHFDHIAACADDNGTPIFANARYIMARDEWDYWVTESQQQGKDVFHRKLLGIKEQLQLIEPDAEILDGVRILDTPGHTYHHICVEFASADETLLCTIDTMDHPLQGKHPTWGANWDVDSAKSIASRKKMLQRAVDKKALVHGFHFPFPGLGHFTNDGDNWQWQAIEE